MSDLQLGLLITGVLAIIAVVLFNRWQERKYRKQAESVFKSRAGDPLLDGAARPAAGEGRIEPTLGGGAAGGATGTPVAAGDGVDVTGAAAVPSDEPLPDLAPEPLPPAPGIDEAIDLIGVIRLETPVVGEALEALVARTRTFGKPALWEGREAGEWHGLRPAGRYNELRIGLQLADRRGPVSGPDIQRFVQLVKQFGLELSGSAECGAADSAAKRAMELDAFAADVDVEIGVNVIAGEAGPFAATQVAQLAQEAGFELKPDGVFHFPDGSGEARFTLRNAEPRPLRPGDLGHITTRGITLLLDVPCAAQGVDAFARMVAIGRRLAAALGGHVVDDDRKPLSDPGVETVRRQLAAIYRQMEAFGVPAGSALARRLFS